jgi:hypothetical protein
MLPAASYEGLKRLDLKITRQFLLWDKLNVKLKNDYILMWRLMLGSIFWVFSLIIVAFLDMRHPFLVLLLSVVSFYLPVRLFKSY